MLTYHSASILPLHNNEIHLWLIEPAKITDGELLNSLKMLLSESEVEKIQRYRLPKSQHTALITRAFVRKVLSQYADLPAEKWNFDIAPQGKPEISNPPLPLSFNLSHNDEVIICAVCLNKNIGCDIESLSRKISIKGIARRYFSTTEFEALMTLPSALQKRRFFEYWTLKEAFVKATGLGISQGLESFNFTIGKAETSQFNDNIQLNFAPSCSEQNNQDWYSCLLYPDQKHCVALCVKEHNPINHKQSFNVQVFSGLPLLNHY
ncbi:4'-phosphopantetheinyl transferase superfamily protein [Psychromonas sp.]|uniref:4'-phosphopantetheinyl transferase family protein n=1 Tax=Psychromonas sp. TaxID=1884585 RepID=UPI003562956A